MTQVTRKRCGLQHPRRLSRGGVRDRSHSGCGSRRPRGTGGAAPAPLGPGLQCSRRPGLNGDDQVNNDDAVMSAPGTALDRQKMELNSVSEEKK